MTEIRHFNSRRLYCRKGQIIVWQETVNGAGEPVILFSDRSRGVYGAVRDDFMLGGEAAIRIGYLNGNGYQPADAGVEWKDLYAWAYGDERRAEFQSIYDSYPDA